MQATRLCLQEVSEKHHMQGLRAPFDALVVPLKAISINVNSSGIALHGIFKDMFRLFSYSSSFSLIVFLVLVIVVL